MNNQKIRNHQHYLERSLLSDEYEVLEVLGEGGFGVVLKAFQKTLGRPVALKLIAAQALNNGRERFLRESQAMSKLDHDNIVKVYKCGILPDDGGYLVMQLVQGITLAEHLKTIGTLNADAFMSVFRQLCAALMELHHIGLIHRDIKPSNILLSQVSDGIYQVKLADFGLCKYIAPEFPDQQLTEAGQTVGTPTYMSPEQCNGMGADHRSDIYSLGCVMYEALTGSPPFVSENPWELMMMHSTVQKQTFGGCAVSDDAPAFESLVFRAMQKNPKLRQQSMVEFTEELVAAEKKCAEKKTPVKCTEQSVEVTAQHSAKWSKWRKLIGLCLVSSALTAAVIITIFGGQFFSRRQEPLLAHGNSRDLYELTRTQVAKIPLIKPLDRSKLLRSTYQLAVASLNADANDHLLLPVQKCECLDWISCSDHENGLYEKAFKESVMAIELDAPADVSRVERVLTYSGYPLRARNTCAQTVEKVLLTRNWLAPEMRQKRMFLLYRLADIYISMGLPQRAQTLLDKYSCRPELAANNPLVQQIALEVALSNHNYDQAMRLLPPTASSQSTNMQRMRLRELIACGNNSESVNECWKIIQRNKDADDSDDPTIRSLANLVDAYNNKWNAKQLQEFLDHSSGYFYFTNFFDWDLREYAQLAEKAGQRKLAKLALLCADNYGSTCRHMQ